ncbi:hypothetical protein [Aquibacillus saliphilus]|uniref:hypothetical protein n=1 Tax=Aquibacillus saliphilus TaxID=1909422 RepID=UPI001CF0755E|nr:hypothetical protein [Aquibacillus saliphilus]
MGFIKNKFGSGANLNFLEPVSTFSAISTTYPNPKVKDSTFVLDNGTRYRYSGKEWENIGQVVIDNGSVIGNYSITYNTDNQTLDFKFIG